MSQSTLGLALERGFGSQTTLSGADYRPAVEELEEAITLSSMATPKQNKRLHIPVVRIHDAQVRIAEDGLLFIAPKASGIVHMWLFIKFIKQLRDIINVVLFGKKALSVHFSSFQLCFSGRVFKVTIHHKFENSRAVCSGAEEEQR